ncbi:MAG: glycosyl transferase [Proteobacteria bacterium SG_bin6]|nr:MAG: glycosyl transferase [Proteobacteria bacterium SG_bin6]
MIEVLIPTYQRPTALAVTLTALAFQTRLPKRIIISDQSDVPVTDVPEIGAIVLLLRAKGVVVEFHRNRPRRGLAHQRQFLLDHARANQLLFLDDDVISEPWLLALLGDQLARAGCGFIGSAVIGLSHRHDVRPCQQAIEFWDESPRPERIAPDGPGWDRHRLHNAANLWHVQQRLAPTPAAARLYKIAWIGGCVLYDRAKLLACGGFDFWRDLPAAHAGEDVFAQQRVMAHFGGAGLIPSGAYHLELATTVPDRAFDVPHRLVLA